MPVKPKFGNDGTTDTPAGLFPRPPSSMFGNWKATSVTPDVRAAASKWLDRVLNREGDTHYDEMIGDPKLQLAYELISRANPQAFHNVSSFQVMNPPTPGINGTYTPPSGMVTIHPDLTSMNNFEGSLNTIRHELAHSKGMEDNGVPNAYDVTAASDILHKDIKLPSERKANARRQSPTNTASQSSDPTNNSTN